MSMIDWFNRPRENPWESARRFRQEDPLASRRIGQEGVEPGQEDPLADRFQPQDLETPMTAGEQAFEERLAEADEIANREAEAVIQRVEIERQRKQQESEDAAMFGQPQGQTGGGQLTQTGSQTTGGQVPQVSGNLSQSRQQVLQEAGRYVGSPYQLGGRTVQGVDCSGLVMSVYNQAGFDISQHSAGWQGRNIPGVRTAVNNLQPGDIVAWKDGSHIAIYAGNGMIVDASSRRGTSYRPLWAPQDQVYGIKLRFPGE